MKKLAVLTILAALLGTACDDDDTKDSTSGTGTETSDTGTETSVDFAKFCNIVMGKACGFNISDDEIASCLDEYKTTSEKYAEKYADKCKDVMDAYYKCVINVKLNDCTGKGEECQCMDDSMCKTEAENAHNCMHD